MLFDTHTHLNDEAYKDNLEEVIKRAQDKNVNKMIVVGYDLKSSLEAIRIAKQYDFIYAAIGIHPNTKDELNEQTLNKIEELLNESKVVAIGEIGLDYYYDKTYKKLQKEYFQKQIILANKYNKAIIIHSRDAGQETLEVLKNNKQYIDRGIMHCYSYSLELAREFVKLGLKISFAGPLTFLNAKTNKGIVEELSFEDLLIETDCPYLAPHPYRGKQNEPSYLYLVAEEMARLKGVSLEEVAKTTTNNALEVFDIKK